MQALVALTLGETLQADPPDRTSVRWLSATLGGPPERVEALVERLLADGAVVTRRDRAHEIRHELGAEFVPGQIELEVPVELTDHGRELVLRWLARAGPLLDGWPPVTGPDDATG